VVASEARRRIGGSEELAALAHPVRLDLMNYLMSAGPATASRCARAVRDTPSNCSYHLRVLARHGLVEPVDRADAGGSADGRERPWRATVTGFGVDEESADPEQAAAFAAIAVQRDQRLATEYLASRDQLEPDWAAAAGLNTYTLRMTAAELTELTGRLDALIRPYLAPTRADAPAGSQLVHLGVHGFPQEPEELEREEEEAAE
jgi:DNA-binding transcriptional ArsR family regulator